MLYAKDFRCMARERLNGYIMPSIGCLLLYGLIIGVATSTVIGAIVLVGPLWYGYKAYWLDRARNWRPTVGTLFEGFTRCFGTSLATYLLQGIFTFLWGLLLIVPGVIKSYSYAMCPYILRDCPTMEALEVIDTSRAMMEGNKWRLFCLQLSFIGWSLLCVVTFGIAGLYVDPYRETAMATFYDAVKAEYAEENPEFAYILENENNANA